MKAYEEKIKIRVNYLAKEESKILKKIHLTRSEAERQAQLKQDKI